MKRCTFLLFFKSDALFRKQVQRFKGLVLYVRHRRCCDKSMQLYKYVSFYFMNLLSKIKSEKVNMFMPYLLALSMLNTVHVFTLY